MKRLLLYISIFVSFITIAGNEDRSGSAGAYQLLINPFGQSSGSAGALAASVTGVEASFWNIAGIATTKKTELHFSRTSWLRGSQIFANGFGFAQRFKNAGVLTVNVMSLSMGEIDITTYDNPEGGIGTYKPQFTNVGVGYARTFSNNIHGGINVKLISEAIHNVNALGVAFDAGVQYITGEKDNISFGIALKNAGPKMSYGGDGLKWDVEWANGNVQKGEVPSQSFDLPLLMNISAGYRMDIGEAHAVQTGFNFSSNAFSYDQYRVGAEYRFKTYLAVRAGYAYEKGITSVSTRRTAFTGPAGGFTVSLPLKKNGPVFSFDYSYRDTNPFQGTHTFGARLTL